MREVVYRPRATFDIESIVIYLGQVQGAPKAARRVYGEIKASIQEMAKMPTLGHPFVDDALSQKYRTWLVGNYRIFFTYNDERLTVWRVLHTRQDIDDYALVGLE